MLSKFIYLTIHCIENCYFNKGDVPILKMTHLEIRGSGLSHFHQVPSRQRLVRSASTSSSQKPNRHPLTKTVQTYKRPATSPQYKGSATDLRGMSLDTDLSKKLNRELKNIWNVIQKMSGHKLTIALKKYTVTSDELNQCIKSLTGRYQQLKILIDGRKKESLTVEDKFDVTLSENEVSIAVLLINSEIENILTSLENKQGKSGHTAQMHEIVTNLKTFSNIATEISQIWSGEKLNEHKLELILKKMVKLNQDLKSQKSLTLNERHIITEADIFCKLLGLNHEIGERLWSLDESYCLHQTTLYFIERWMKVAEDEINDKEVEFTSDVSGIEMSSGKREKFISTVQHLGLTKEKANQLFSTIPIEYIDQQTPSYWIMRYITNIIQYHPVFTNVLRYMYSEDKIGEWFEQNIEITKSHEMRDTSTFKIKMINHDSSEKSQTAVDAFLEEIQAEENCEVLFHGTDHKSAKSILEEGILISQGKPCQDFSSNDGFYLSYSYEKARERSSIALPHNHAVLVFKIQKSFLEVDGKKRLDLSGDKNKWEEIVTFCRKGCRYRKTKESLLGGVEFIKGPMCQNGRAVAMGEKAKGFGRTEKLQLCIRDDDYAKMFGMVENIAGAFFL
ncbi:unnamed protein product [Lymnaea stagnalis]|uniref:PARP n=1 Tax=Lymnaea stagnalis TaxID=6523 RepID=A0AAV2IJJ3_LYMST